MEKYRGDGDQTVAVAATEDGVDAMGDDDGDESIRSDVGDTDSHVSLTSPATAVAATAAEQIAATPGPDASVRSQTNADDSDLPSYEDGVLNGDIDDPSTLGKHIYDHMITSDQVQKAITDGRIEAEYAKKLWLREVKRPAARYRVDYGRSPVAQTVGQQRRQPVFAQNGLLELFDVMMEFFVTEPIHQVLRRTVMSFAASAVIDTTDTLSPFATV